MRDSANYLRRKDRPIAEIHLWKDGLLVSFRFSFLDLPDAERDSLIDQLIVFLRSTQGDRRRVLSVPILDATATARR